MHLLKVIPEGADELKIELFQVFDEQVDYAILSHRWGLAKDEVSYLDMQNGLARQKKGFQKIKACCRQALRDGLEYIWVDTCCIDKSSSAELSEAINSMYEYYKQSTICYAYLFDVNSDEDIYSVGSTFRSSQWFTRGWTLQELIAPANITFFAKDWSVISQKSEISKVLHEITNVMEEVLLHRRDVVDVCIAQKMHWASNRRTTRIEDRAYSLIGLFNVSLPIIYGEGQKAFRRLQEEIIRTCFDHTIFAWELNTVCSGLLANSPDAFDRSADVREVQLADYVKSYGYTTGIADYAVKNRGIEIRIPYFSASGHDGLYVALLAARLKGRYGFIPVYLRDDVTKPPKHFFRTRTSSSTLSTQIIFNNHNKIEVHETIWVAEPKDIVVRNVRELVSDHALTKTGDDEEATCYSLRVWAGMNGHNIFDSHILGSFPMPQSIETSTGIQILQLEPRDIWVVAVSLKVNLEAMILLVVIDNTLMVHFEAYNVEDSPYKGLDTAEACKNFYKRCLSSTEPPCTGFVVKESNGTIVKNMEAPGEGSSLITILYHLHWNANYFGRAFNVLLVASNEEEMRRKLSLGCFSEARISPKYNKSLKEFLSHCKPLYEDSDCNK